VLGRRLSLGRYLGIGLYVHWTFALLIIYVAITARGEGPAGMVYGVAQLLGVFLCVTLHEYGHAMAARRFGIPTLDITLLPIGGVARLERMPRIPWQELVVAIAGPAVNVVIACSILLGFRLFLNAGVRGDLIASLSDDVLLINLINRPSLIGFALVMLIVNVMLVLFNMIPAFPMDGGRVFRSVLAMLMDYRKATTLASRVGLVVAALMAGYAVYHGYPMPVLIALFIGYAGLAEARQVDVIESVRGLMVRDAMIRNPPVVTMDTPLWALAKEWQFTSVAAMPVLGPGDTVVGVVTLKAVCKAIVDGTDPNTTAGQLANHDAVAVHAASSLEEVLVTVGRQHRTLPVVDSFGQLTGILDFDTVTTRGALAQMRLPLPVSREESSFEAFN
jgi:stage IV sporulation protein FB